MCFKNIIIILKYTFILKKCDIFLENLKCLFYMKGKLLQYANEIIVHRYSQMDHPQIGSNKVAMDHE